MKKEILFLLFCIASIQLAQPTIIPNSAPQLNLDETLQRKIVSHKLISDVRQGLLNNINRTDALVDEEKVGVVIYFDDYPSGNEISELEALGINCFVNTWIPPLANHPYGFILAKLPPSQLNNALSKSFIKKMDSSTHEAYPNNNLGTAAMATDIVWAAGFDGTGVKVAVLDSGLDPFYEGTDLPNGYERLDCWQYPITDPIVDNKVSGHGTHVTGSVLGRGALSSGNTGNGGGAYKGAAPGADLVFLKIGGDASSSASSAAMIGAMQEAVNTYDADILTMSYGGWYEHHDGSSTTEQTVDWVYSMGKPFFISAGNEGGAGRHYSGTVGAGSETALIPITVSGTAGEYYLYFNLVWLDGIVGLGSVDLDLEIYNSVPTLLTTVPYLGQLESIRGTESERFYYYSSNLLNGSYYLKVINKSASDQNFHIYEAYNRGRVKFQNPEPDFTIGQPASADHACAVGAYTTRASWTDYSGIIQNYGDVQDDIASFSSRGPRIDGEMKPQISAPGARILSLRDTYVLTIDDRYTIDNDGNLGVGPKNYYVMRGTSMACPLAAGAAALYLEYYPNATAQDVYDALQNNATTDAFTTSTVPNSKFGFGKLNIYDAIFNSPPLDDQLQIDIKVLLEGAINPAVVSDPQMTADLGSAIPLAQPFNVAPWSYSGTEHVNISVPAFATDWVLVELRSDETTTEVMKAALVDYYGHIFNADGTPFNINADPGEYYIVVHHRNHLSIMSAAKVTLTNNIPTPLAVPQVELKTNNLISY
jgi:subtilisin family serine protease